jgi:hypothetical protein
MIYPQISVLKKTRAMNKYSKNPHRRFAALPPQAGEEFQASSSGYSLHPTKAKTLNGLPEPPLILSGAAMISAPLGGN